MSIRIAARAHAARPETVERRKKRRDETGHW
jgi:hypothetical protein